MNDELRSHMQGEFVKTYDREGRRGLAIISMRFGKTKFALMTVEPGARVLIAHYKTAIRKSWEGDIKKFGIPTTSIKLSTFASLKKVFVKGEDYDQIIVDEAHKLSPAQIETLNTISKGKDLLLLTGYARMKNKKRIQHELGIRTIIEYLLEDAIRDKLVKDYRVNIVDVEFNQRREIMFDKGFGPKLMTDKEIYDHYTKQMEYWEKRRDDAIQNKAPENEIFRYDLSYKKIIGARANFIYNCDALKGEAMSIMKSLSDKKVLMFTMRTDIADSFEGDVYHSKDNDDEVLESFIISENGHMNTVSSISEGITIHNLQYIVCHTLTSNSEDFIQKIGRGLELDNDSDGVCNVILLRLVNTSHEKWIEQALQSLSPFKVFLPEGISIAEKTKKDNPDKELYVYHGGFCFLCSKTAKGKDEYAFLGTPDKKYSIPKDKLIKL